MGGKSVSISAPGAACKWFHATADSGFTTSDTTAYWIAAHLHTGANRYIMVMVQVDLVEGTPVAYMREAGWTDYWQSGYGVAMYTYQHTTIFKIPTFLPAVATKLLGISRITDARDVTLLDQECWHGGLGARNAPGLACRAFRRLSGEDLEDPSVSNWITVSNNPVQRAYIVYVQLQIVNAGEVHASVTKSGYYRPTLTTALADVTASEADSLLSNVRNIGISSGFFNGYIGLAELAYSIAA
eukprot:gene23457-17316_t